MVSYSFHAGFDYCCYHPYSIFPPHWLLQRQNGRSHSASVKRRTPSSNTEGQRLIRQPFLCALIAHKQAPAPLLKYCNRFSLRSTNVPERGREVSSFTKVFAFFSLEFPQLEMAKGIQANSVATFISSSSPFSFCEAFPEVFSAEHDRSIRIL